MVIQLGSINVAPKHYTWIGNDCPPDYERVGSIDVADPADVNSALDRGRRIGSIYDGGSGSCAEPCTADTYRRREPASIQ